ncbi:MAG: hypothetical protein J6386_01785 [Candidatus Synoicihabitans palmerolidicus]|nr:hypothetical protein [Candidatus Synoicihabitans palmerolidicus]
MRTALAKKWNSPVWVSMHYMPDIPPGNFNTDNYEVAAWSGALTGGRVNHLGYGQSADIMFAGDFLRAETRIRMLNYIAPQPVDSPVAVVFGHAAAMNQAGPYFNDVGMKLADELWFRGIPTDLIPTSEIDNGSLRVDANGAVTYGEQHYAAPQWCFTTPNTKSRPPPNFSIASTHSVLSCSGSAPGPKILTAVILRVIELYLSQCTSSAT